MNKLLAIFSLFLSSTALGALSDSDLQSVPGNQMLANGGVENSLASWTATTATPSLDTTNKYKGKSSGKLTFSSSTGNVQSNKIYNTQVGGVQLEASCRVKTTLTTIQVCSLQNLAEQSCVTVPSTGNWEPVTAYFVGSSSATTGGVRIKTTSSTTGTVNWDECYVGPIRSASQVSQSYLYGAAIWPGVSSCVWSVTNNNNFTGYSAVSACTLPSGSGLLGNASAPATKIPAVSFAQWPKGEYHIIATGGFEDTGSAAGCSYRFSDGTNVSQAGSVYGGFAGSTVVPMISGHISVPSPLSNITLEIQGTGQGGSQTCKIDSDIATTIRNLSIYVYYYPSQSQLAISPTQASGNWAGTATLTGTTTSSSVTDPGSVSGSVTVSGTPQAISCSAASSLVGTTCSNLAIGANYLVCFSGNVADSAATATVNTYLTDGSNNVLVGDLKPEVASNNGFSSISGCGQYTASANSATFKIRGATNGGTATFNLNTFSIAQISYALPAPLLVGSVTSNSTGLERIERAIVGSSSPSTNCNTNPCGFVKQSGSWITTVGRNSTGSYQVNITNGEFSDFPSCTCGAIQNGSSANVACGVVSNGSTSVTVTTSVNNVGQDTSFNIICMGPR